MAQVINLGFHANQKPIDDAIEAGKRRIILRCGRRFGKSELCAREALKFAVRNPNTTTWWVSPFYELSTIGHDYFAEFLARERLYDQLIRKKYTDPHLFYIFKNGAKLRFKTSENEEQLIGRGIGCLIFDEAAVAKASVWAKLSFGLLDNPNSLVLLLSTPRGRNWFHDKEMFAIDSGGSFYEGGKIVPGHEGDPGNPWAVFHYTTYDNPLFTREHVEKFIEENNYSPEEIEREILAMYNAGAMDAFPGWDKCLIESAAPQAGHRYIAGVDLGHKRDFCAMSVWDMREVREVFIERWRDPAWFTQIQRIANIARRYNNCRIIMESNSPGDPVIEDTRVGYGLDVEEWYTGQRNKSLLMKQFGVGCSRGELGLVNDPVANSEMEAFTILKADRTGLFSGSAPSGKHDDTVIARMLGYWGCTGYSGITIPESYRSTGVIRAGYQTARAM